MTLNQLLDSFEAEGTEVVAASVQIVDGVNEGKRLITDGTGYFSLNDLFPASFTLRATHERYRTVDHGTIRPHWRRRFRGY